MQLPPHDRVIGLRAGRRRRKPRTAKVPDTYWQAVGICSSSALMHIAVRTEARNQLNRLYRQRRTLD